MAESDLNKTISVFDADSEVVYGESNRKRRLSDSSAFSGCKRLCSVSESTSWSSDQAKNGIQQKASGADIISTESDDSQSVPRNCLTKIASLELPSRLIEWERKCIEKLNISIVHVPDTKPLDLIQCGETKNYEETEKINELKKYVQKSPLMGHLRSLDHLYTSFSELSSESLWEMAPNDDEKVSMIPTWVPEHHMLWFYRFHCQAHNFSNQLYHILKRRENGCSVHESHMQALFEAFACMFGLQSGLSSVPCLEKDTKRIMNLEISGAADIIFLSKMFSPFQEVKQGTQHPSVVAVCEFSLEVWLTHTVSSTDDEILVPFDVKLEFLKKESRIFFDVIVKRDSPKLNQSCSPLNSRTCTDIKINFENSAEQISSTTNTEASHNKTVLHLDDKIIGQHGGKLLFHFSDTIKNGKIFGLVVQETQVTFTMLEMSVEQYNDIVEGNVNHRNGDRPVLKVTKPYDYLKTQDRESIIEAFIKLAMLQRKIL